MVYRTWVIAGADPALSGCERPVDVGIKAGVESRGLSGSEANSNGVEAVLMNGCILCFHSCLF